MPIVTYGTRGRPVLLFPTAAADYLENERFFLVKAVEPAIMAGRIRLFSIDSINQHAWMDRSLPVREQARRQALYSGYVEEEVVPYIRNAVGNPSERIATTGASFGAFHAANAFFRRPDLFDTLIGMSGFYDLGPSYLQRLLGRELLLQQSCVVSAGTVGRSARYASASQPHRDRDRPGSVRSAACVAQFLGDPAPEREYRTGSIVWGHDVNHDWPWWRKMLPHFIDKLGY